MRNQYNAIFLMCANKVKENKYNFTPLSIFIQKIQGVWNFTPRYTLMVSIYKVGN